MYRELCARIKQAVYVVYDLSLIPTAGYQVSDRSLMNINYMQYIKGL